MAIEFGVERNATGLESNNIMAMGAGGPMVAGFATVNCRWVTARSIVLVTPRGVLAGSLYEDFAQRVPGVSFAVVSTNGADTPNFQWLIFEPVR